MEGCEAIGVERPHGGSMHHAENSDSNYGQWNDAGEGPGCGEKVEQQGQE